KCLAAPQTNTDLEGPAAPSAQAALNAILGLTQSRNAAKIQKWNCTFGLKCLLICALALGVNNSSLLCIAEVYRKDAEPLRFRNGSTCGRVKASSIQHPGSSIASYFGAREATIGSKRGSLRSNGS